jgi:hypothetical protein
VPEAERMSRADLIAVGNAYFEAVERNTGKDYYPFTDDCLRYENGIITAAPAGTVNSRGNPVQSSARQPLVVVVENLVRAARVEHRECRAVPGDIFELIGQTPLAALSSKPCEPVAQRPGHRLSLRLAGFARQLLGQSFGL